MRQTKAHLHCVAFFSLIMQWDLFLRWFLKFFFFYFFFFMVTLLSLIPMPVTRFMLGIYLRSFNSYNILKSSKHEHLLLGKKAPLIIHMWVFYSALQGHVNGQFSGQSKDLPEATTALVWYQTYNSVYMLHCTFYLYSSFNYPALPAFEVWSISFYLMPADLHLYTGGI